MYSAIQQKFLSIRTGLPVENTVTMQFYPHKCSVTSNSKTVIFNTGIFYCVNTSYPMDNCFTGRRDRSRQTSEKEVLYILPTGLVTECAFARWYIVLPFLSRQCDVIASFSFGVKSVQTCFLQRNVFEVLQRTLPFYLISSCISSFY